MSIAVRALEATARRPGPRCEMGRVLARMDAATRAEVDEALAEDAITAKALSVVLAEDGWQVPAFTVTRHRRRDCACDRR